MLTRRDQRRVDRVCMTCVRIAAILALSRPPGPAWAQGGPPMVTDDPDTPGNGNWEINLATSGSHSSGRWEIAAPDADINYGGVTGCN